MSAPTPAGPNRGAAADQDRLRAAERDSEQQFAALKAREVRSLAEFIPWLDESRSWLRNRVESGIHNWRSDDRLAHQLALKAWEMACRVDLPHPVRDRVAMPPSLLQYLKCGEVLSRIDLLLEESRRQAGVGEGSLVRGVPGTGAQGACPFDTTPTCAEPPPHRILAAKAVIPAVLNASNSDPGEITPPPPHKRVLAAHLVNLIGNEGYRRDEATWAIHQLVREGKLSVEGALKPALPFAYSSDRTEPLPPRPGRYDLSRFPGPIPFDKFLVQTTDELFRWYKSGCPEPAETPLSLRRALTRVIQQLREHPTETLFEKEARFPTA